VENEDALLEKCKALIEVRLAWGSSAIWTNQDFEKLSEVIVEKTKINLSPATLKRIWGKVKYNSRPTTTTLDTLAQFIDYDNWRSFRIGNSDVSRFSNGHETRVDKGGEEKTHRRKINVKWLVSTSVLMVILVLFLFFRKKEPTSDKKPVPTDEYSFTSKKIVSEGVPNSVLFSYDASKAENGDTIYIQQSWDTRLRQQVNKEEHDHRSIYYQPGYFLAKLVVNDQIVKEHALFIRSNGWLPLVEQQNVPVYFKPEEVINDGVMAIPVKKLIDNNIPLQPETPWVAFHNAREFGDLRSDNFIFETEVKNDYGVGAGVCQLTEVHIRLEGGMLMVPLSIKGCVSEIGLVDVDGRKPDSSLLGCDFSDWVNIRMVVKDKRGELFINHKKVYDLNFEIPTVKIVGLLYRFQGTGSVNFAKFTSIDGELIYEDNF